MMRQSVLSGTPSTHYGYSSAGATTTTGGSRRGSHIVGGQGQVFRANQQRSGSASQQRRTAYQQQGQGTAKSSSTTVSSSQATPHKPSRPSSASASPSPSPASSSRHHHHGSSSSSSSSSSYHTGGAVGGRGASLTGTGNSRFSQMLAPADSGSSGMGTGGPKTVGSNGGGGAHSLRAFHQCINEGDSLSSSSGATPPPTTLPTRTRTDWDHTHHHQTKPTGNLLDIDEEDTCNTKAHDDGMGDYDEVDVAGPTTATTDGDDASVQQRRALIDSFLSNMPKSKPKSVLDKLDKKSAKANTSSASGIPPSTACTCTTTAGAGNAVPQVRSLGSVSAGSTAAGAGSESKPLSARSRNQLQSIRQAQQLHELAEAEHTRTTKAQQQQGRSQDEGEAPPPSLPSQLLRVAEKRSSSSSSASAGITGGNAVVDSPSAAVTPHHQPTRTAHVASTVTPTTVATLGKQRTGAGSSKTVPPKPKGPQPPTAEQVAALEGTSLGPRKGEFLHHFPQTGYYACRRCRLPFFTAKSKVAVGGGYPAFGKHFRPSLQATVSLATLGELDFDISGGCAIRMECVRCNGFIGLLSQTRQTDTGDFLQVNSHCIQYVDETVPGEYLAAEGPFSAIEEEEEEAERKAAAERTAVWGTKRPSRKSYNYGYSDEDESSESDESDYEEEEEE